MIMAAVVAQAADNAAMSAATWCVLIALVSLAGSLASIWRAFVTPKEYATLRQLIALENRFDKHLEQERQDAKDFDARFERFQSEVLGKLDDVKQDIADLRVELEKRT